MKHKTSAIVIAAMSAALLFTACGTRSGTADVVMTTESEAGKTTEEAACVQQQNEGTSQNEGAPRQENLPRIEDLDPVEDRELIEALQEGADVHVFETMEEMIRSMYAVEGKLYASDWEMEMFKQLPQEEPYDFVVRTDGILRGEGSAEDHMQLAEKLSERGCSVRVKEMRAVFEGEEEIEWITIVTTTPAHLWEISRQLDEWLHVEQLYPQVDARFETQIWP